MLGPDLGPFGFNLLMLGQRVESGDFWAMVSIRAFGCRRISLKRKSLKGFIAMKVLTVNMTAGIINENYWEVPAMKQVNDANRKHPGYQHCLHLFHCFVTKSYHGPHLSLVTQALRSDLIALQRRQPSGAFSVRQTKRIVKQVFLALDYLHRDCNLVHTDVKPQNILVSIQASDETNARYLEDNPSATYGPQIQPKLSADPIITVKSQPLPDFGLDSDLYNLVLKLVNYGEAIPLDKIVQQELCQPVLLRAPEVILGHPWSTPIDIWSVGCLIFEYLTGAILFQLYQIPPVTETDSHLQGMIDIVGGFPLSFLASCSRRDEYFNERGELNHPAAFIRKCLTIDPSARPSALELLEDDWLRDA